MRSFRSGSLLASLVAVAACDAGPRVVTPGTAMQLTLHGMRALDASAEGHLMLWGIDAAGAVVFSMPVSLPQDVGSHVVSFDFPAGATRFQLTVEPPADADPAPSRSVMLAGDMQGDLAHLRIEGAVTEGGPLERDPGHHSLFTSSNNVELGYPSFENAGLWLFSISARVNQHGTREVKLTPLSRGWVYEGWIVRQPGTARETWVPYGKFTPDERGLLTSRDNTGSEVFSGDADFRNGGVEDVPGGEWTTTRVAADLGLAMPGGLALPLALDSVDATGAAIWYHVITIEPVADESEAMLSDRPFLLRPYRNAIGAGGPGEPRAIVYRASDPTGEITVAR